MKNLDSVFAAYMAAWAIFFFRLLRHDCPPGRGSSRRHRASKEFRESGQVAWQGRNESGSCTVSARRPDSLEAVEPFLLNLFLDPTYSTRTFGLLRRPR